MNRDYSSRAFLVLITILIPVTLLSGNANVIAKVGSIDITSSEVELTAQNLERGRFYHASKSGSRIKEFSFEALEYLMFLTLRSEEGARNGISADKEKIEQAIHAMKGGRSEEEFNHILKERSLDAAEMKRRLRRNMIAQAYVERLLQESTRVSDQECREFFENNRSMFTTGDLYYVFMITAKIPPTRDAAAIQKANDVIEKARQELARGASFESVARKYSQDEFASAGGEMQPSPLALFSESIRDAVQNLQPGKVSDVVVSIYGLHLLLLKSIEPSKVLSFDETKDQIQDLLTRKKREEVLEQDKVRLIKSAEIAIYDPDLEKEFRKKYD